MGARGGGGQSGCGVACAFEPAAWRGLASFLSFPPPARPIQTRRGGAVGLAPCPPPARAARLQASVANASRSVGLSGCGAVLPQPYQVAKERRRGPPRRPARPPARPVSQSVAGAHHLSFILRGTRRRTVVPSLLLCESSMPSYSEENDRQGAQWGTETAVFLPSHSMAILRGAFSLEW